MSEYVFRDAPGYGCDMSDMMDGGRVTVGDYFASESTDHYGTLHEPIVRCRDCVFFTVNYSTVDRHGNVIATGNLCDLSELWVKPNGFCAQGEKRGDE